MVRAVMAEPEIHRQLYAFTVVVAKPAALPQKRALVLRSQHPPSRYE
ncbi:hypothetical protein MAV100_02985 [Mycobacterium avium subsp. hominissuis 100]|nr:hypothetical protein MAV100_02985 [Mycobacterium avium subsp. hominissuis 100]